MIRKLIASAAIAAASLAGAAQHAGALERGAPLHFAQVGGCGWYVVLSCTTSRPDAQRFLRRLGGNGVGGGAGTYVVDTYDYPNFRDGFWCGADGPYRSRYEAEGVAWTEAVPDAYVKNSC